MLAEFFTVPPEHLGPLGFKACIWLIIDRAMPPSWPKTLQTQLVRCLVKVETKSEKYRDWDRNIAPTMWLSTLNPPLASVMRQLVHKCVIACGPLLTSSVLQVARGTIFQRNCIYPNWNMAGGKGCLLWHQGNSSPNIGFQYFCSCHWIIKTVITK